jgi:hypothetical protein
MYLIQREVNPRLKGLNNDVPGYLKSISAKEHFYSNVIFYAFQGQSVKPKWKEVMWRFTFYRVNEESSYNQINTTI